MKFGFKEKCHIFTLQLFLLIEHAIADQLYVVDHIMLDVSKPIRLPKNETRIRAVCATFHERNPIWLQLWRPTSEVSKWQLVWQAHIKPKYADRSEEVITLLYKEYSPEVKPEYRLGLINEVVPGPVKGITHENSSILLSIDTLEEGLTLPINESTVKEFDALQMNYDFSLDVCSTLKCSEFWDLDRCSRFEELVTAASSSSSSFEIFSEDMMLGMIIWNLVLSFVVICILITIVCMCNTLEKRKKDVRRFDNKYRNLEAASNAGTMSSTKGDDVMYTHGKSSHHGVAKSSTSRDSWGSDGDKKKLHVNDAMEY